MKTQLSLEKICSLLKLKMLQTIQTAKTGHLGACTSSLELMVALYFGGILNYDSKNPKHPLRDFVFNRGHLGPLKYNLFSMIGWLEESEMSQYREYGSRLAGHEDMYLTPGVDISPNGSLGMLLSYAVGCSIALKDKLMSNKIFCFLGDGEEQEGMVSEAARHASSMQATNLICIIDKNGGQLSARTNQTDSASNLLKIWEGYGWTVLEIMDGHNLEEIISVYEDALEISLSDPVLIIANTVKGNGIEGAEEDYCGFHVVHGSEAGDTVRAIDIDSVVEDLTSRVDMDVCIPECSLFGHVSNELDFNSNGLLQEILRKVSDDQVHGNLLYDFEHHALEVMDKYLKSQMYLITSDYPIRALVYSGDFLLKNCNYLNVGIREQHMTALVHGIKFVRPESLCVIMCGDAFLYRHADQFNALAQAGTHVIVFSVQAGLSGAKNGSTHQSSGQPGMMLTMPGVSMYEPSSGKEFVCSLNQALTDNSGVHYVRLNKVAVIDSDKVQVSNEGGYSILGEAHDKPDVVFVASGMCAAEALKAKEDLDLVGVKCNALSVFDFQKFSRTSEVSLHLDGASRVVTSYNGNSTILSSLLYKKIFTENVTVGEIVEKGFQLGVTGSMSDLLKHFGLDAESLKADVLASQNV